MPYNYPTPNLYKPVSEWKTSNSNGSFLSSAIGTAAKVGLGVATGGGSEVVSGILNLIPAIFQGITGASQLRKASQI